MIFFIADAHFGHANIIKMCNRPFETVEEMNETIIKNWNSRITNADSVYILGDMFYRCDDVESILERLHGKKYLIIGNHDNSWMNNVELNRYFTNVSNMEITSDVMHAITLCHYPLLTWKRDKRSFMIHGHIHNDTAEDFFPVLCQRENILNAGVEINGYMPVTFDELIENNKRFKNEFWQKNTPIE